jgi:hypothetical protein
MDLREGIWGPLWPVWVPATIAAVWMLARAESAAVANARWWLVVYGCLAVILAAQSIARAFALSRTRGTDHTTEPEEEQAIQRLGLTS